MRRSEREITDTVKIDDIIKNTHIIRIGFADNGKIYIVPLNYGFLHRNGQRIFYFHGAKAGRKYELLKQSPAVGFELDNNYELVPSRTACSYSASYQSIIGTGLASIVENPEEKVSALELLMQNNTAESDWDFNTHMIDSVCVYKLTVTEISCKENKI